MEFHHAGVNVYFRLLLQALQAAVEITYINFEASAADPDANTRRLVEAISAARVTPIRTLAPPVHAAAGPDAGPRPGPSIRHLSDRAVRAAPRASFGQD
jgi:hypothetical protein